MNGSIIITGASSGIGKACALYLDGMGFKVYAGVRKEEDKVKLKQEGTEKLTPIILDVTKEDTILDAVGTIGDDAQHPLIGVVNNAGLGHPGLLEATPVEEFRNVMEVNVIGVHAVIRAFLPLLRKNKGRIVNVGSAAGFAGAPMGSTYCASKYAVRGLTESLRWELKPLGISVSMVAPGNVVTGIFEKDRAYLDKINQNTPSDVLAAYELPDSAGKKYADPDTMASTVEVARAVAHGLTAEEPELFYFVGEDAEQLFENLKPKVAMEMIEAGEYS